MNSSITQESFDSLSAHRANPSYSLQWNPLFILPVWLKVWWQKFGSGAELQLNAVRINNEIIGVSPLQVDDGTACFIGNVDVCDYLDFIVSPGREAEFFNILLDEGGLFTSAILGKDTIEMSLDNELPLVLFCSGEDMDYEIISRGYNLDITNLLRGVIETWLSEHSQ